MDKWLEVGISLVDEMSKHDVAYQQILRDLLGVEQAYFPVVESPTPQERNDVERYISLCEELEYQRTRIAYLCGRMCVPKGSPDQNVP